jgi:2-hydroxy-6-oxonona-2,4-dienedioate hydrolase
MSSLIQKLQSSAKRIETPCGDGTLVWHVWDETPGGGDPLVLLHGGSGSWTHWLRNIQPLVGAGRRVIAPDLPGFGDSALPPGGDDADAMPAPLEAGLSQIAGDAAVDLVGFSFGGMVAGLWMAMKPSRVKRLVVVGAPAMGVVSSRQADLRGWRHLDDPAARDAIHRHNLAALMVKDPATIDDDALTLHRTNVVRDRLPRRRLAFTRVLADALAHADCPVHAIYGEHDAIYTGRHPQLAAAFALSTPYFVQMHWVPDAGHWVQYEKPGAVDALLAQILEKKPQPEGRA